MPETDHSISGMSEAWALGRSPRWAFGGLRRGRLRIRTLAQIRWIAVAGQLITILIVGLYLKFPLPWVPCLTLIGISAWVNLLITLTTPGQRLAEDLEATLQIGGDILQLAALLYLTGGVLNPFSILLIAATLPFRLASALVSMAMVATLFIGFSYYPLPGPPEPKLIIPAVNAFAAVAGRLMGILVTALYAWHASTEAARMELALNVTQAVLSREQRLSALGALAAAAAHELGTPLSTIAVVARELASNQNPDVREDAELLLSQTARCRAILKRLSEDPEAGDQIHAQMSLKQLCEEVSAPFQAVGDIPIELVFRGTGEEPSQILRRPEILHGLTAILENALDFARTHVQVLARYDSKQIILQITDDGPGFTTEIMSRLGEPYVTSRPDRGSLREEGQGLGLGFFIAKTLLEKTGAEVDFRNARRGGASVTVRWSRHELDSPISELAPVRQTSI
jgi:two-component system sensor histidine kinase RegB